MYKDNIIIISGGSQSDIKQALEQWIELYSGYFKTNINFELYNREENLIIVVDKRINNEKFNFLVNYLCYPEGIEYKISVEGYTTALDKKLYPKDLLNKKLLIYVPENDKEFDNVYAINEDNDAYKIDFGSKVIKVTESKIFKFIDVDFDLLPKPEKINLNKSKFEEIREKKSRKSIENRFNIMLVIISLLTIINILSLFVIENSGISNVTGFILGTCIWIWYYTDYKMLQIDKYYNYSFLIAIAILGYWFFINHLRPYSNDIFIYTYTMPISVIVIQKPLRLIFKRLFRREPVVEKPAPSFWDGVYILTLILSSLAISSLLIDNFK